MNTKHKELTKVSESEKNIKAVKFAFEDGTMQVPAEKDQQEWLDSLHTTFGTTDQDVLDLFVNQILQIACRDRNNLAKEINQVMPLVLAIKPENEVETMLAVQMVGIHIMSMEMMRRAMQRDHGGEVVNNNVNRVTKLSRTFIGLLEALNKHRGKGKQKITVEHVTVNEGGQAVVGNVEYGG